MAEQIRLPYCPHCGKKSFNAGRFKPWYCQSCDFKIYPNVAAAAAVFIFDDKNRILFIERGHDPGKGKLGLPGGFLDPGETAETGIAREILEEVGITVSNITYLSSFPNNYQWGGIHYDTIDLFYTARLTSKNITIDGDEVAAVKWKLRSEVENHELAFPSFIQALNCLDS